MTRRRRSSPFSLFAFQDIITSVTGIMVLLTLMLTLELLHRKETSPAVRTEVVNTRLRSAVGENRREIERLRQLLAAERAEILSVAEFDPQSVAQQLADLQELTEDLEGNLTELGGEQAETARQRNAVLAEQDRREDDAQTLEQLLEEIRTQRDQMARMQQSNRTIYNAAEGADKAAWLVEVSNDGLQTAPVGRAAVPQRFVSVTEFRQWITARDAQREYFVLLVKPQGVARFQAALETLQQFNFDVGFDLLSHDQTAIDPQTGAGVE